jgi:site-specific recombinase XerC
MNAKGKPFKQNTLHDYVVILKPFLLWLVDNDYSDIPEKKIRAIKPPCMDYNVTLPEDLPKEAEIVALIKGSKSVMERAFLAVLYESGARIGECHGSRGATLPSINMEPNYTSTTKRPENADTAG